MSKFHSGYRKEEILKIISAKGSRVHFVGVGGVGMCSLFILSEKMGLSVSGSDREGGRYTDYFLAQGARITIGSAPLLASRADLLVYSLAVSDDNSDLLSAVATGVPSVSRAEYLGALMLLYKERIGISGSHGKSTVSSMLDRIFCVSDRNPTSVIGATVTDTDLPLRIGGREVMIYEACEYKDSFLYLSPTATVFTNLEMDHADYFKDIDAISASFGRAMANSPVSIVNMDDRRLAALSRENGGHTVGYSISCDADYVATDIRSEKGKYSFKIRHEGALVAEISLSVPGKFNVYNALAAFALSDTFGIPREASVLALSTFSGVERRIQRIGELGAFPIYYDYAHHPTEIRETIAAVREMSPGHLTVIFKPHTYSRTAALMDDFARALSAADSVLLSEIDPVREDAIPGINSQALADKIGERAKLIDENNVLNTLSTIPAGPIIIMGAANLTKIKDTILNINSRS